MALDIKIQNCPGSEMRSSNDLHRPLLCHLSLMDSCSLTDTEMYIPCAHTLPHFRDTCLPDNVFQSCTGLLGQDLTSQPGSPAKHCLPGVPHVSQCPETGITILPFWIALFSNIRGPLSSDPALWALHDSSSLPHDTGPANSATNRALAGHAYYRSGDKRRRDMPFFFF